MTAAVDRTLSVLELLARFPAGLSVQTVAAELGLAPSATHRLLNDLMRLGYVCQPRPQGDYALTIRLAALGLAFLGRAGVTDVAQPVLDRLAADSGELVRLSVADGDALIWVAVAQGATSGLRYDPAREQGASAPLAYSAAGRAWAATLPQDRALALIDAQGLTPPPGSAMDSAIDRAQILALLAQVRADGFATAVDCFLAGMAAIAVPVRRSDGLVLGCVSIAGPSVRLTATRRGDLLPTLKAAAQDLAAMAPASAFLGRGRV